MRNPSVDAYLTATVNQVIAATARADVADALNQIGQRAHFSEAQGLQVLALRRYLRLQMRHVDIHQRWAWTPEQARARATTGKAKLLMEEAAKAQVAFAKSNPGYSLAISPLRSLERQIELWVGNLTAKAAAKALLGLVVAELGEAFFAAPPTRAKVDQFARWLPNRGVNPEPSSAAPGTSDHGQLRAVDFVVVRGGQVIAGTRTASIGTDWTTSGWGKKLADAAASTQLIGPLEHPFEPWHWRIA